MKLGIVVIYMVSDENERLLTLHLEKIRKHTHAPYHIYGAANRLQDRFQHHLLNATDVTVCDIPTTQKKRAAEHSYYLKRLIECALADDVTHIVTLHVDSFPVKDGWESELNDLLTDNVSLISVKGPFTSCLFFSGAFYRKYRPSFLLPDETLASREYLDFAESFGPIIPHSGVGFIFKTHQIDTQVYFLPTMNNRIFGGCVYHFGGAILKAVKAESEHGAASRAVVAAKKWFISVLQRLRRLIPGSMGRAIARTGLRRTVRTSEMTALLDDPDAYLARLLC